MTENNIEISTLQYFKELYSGHKIIYVRFSVFKSSTKVRKRLFLVWAEVEKFFKLISSFSTNRYGVAVSSEC